MYRNGKNLLTCGNRNMQSAVLCVSSLQPGREQVHRIERALKATMRVLRETNVLFHRLGQIKFVLRLDGASYRSCSDDGTGRYRQLLGIRHLIKAKVTPGGWVCTTVQ